MIENAYLYEAIIREKSYKCWYDSRYQYYYMGSYHSDWRLNHDGEGDWSRRSFAVIDPSQESDYDKVIGMISYCIDHDTKSANSFGAINFTDRPSVIFSKALTQVIDEIFTKFGMNRVEFCCVVGNPAEDGYDRLVNRVGGRIIGIRHQSTINMASEICDDKLYEVLRSDYLKYLDSKNCSKEGESCTK